MNQIHNDCTLAPQTDLLVADAMCEKRHLMPLCVTQLGSSSASPMLMQVSHHHIQIAMMQVI
jgi:hypothetical protein